MRRTWKSIRLPARADAMEKLRVSPSGSTTFMYCPGT